MARAQPRPTPKRTNTLKPANWHIAQLPGLSEGDRANLAACGIETTLQLCQRTITPQQKQALASQLQIHTQYVNKWSALADLSRVPSVGWQYCGLLLHAGVSSMVQLAHTPAPKLHQQLLKLQVATLQRPDLCPQLGAITQWIAEARYLERSTPSYSTTMRHS